MAYIGALPRGFGVLGFWGFGVWLIGVLERNCLLDFPSTITFLQTKHFYRSHLPDEKASRTGNPSSDNVLDPILELKQRRIVREKKCSTFIDINSCLQRFETASMQCRMPKVNEIQLGFASRIPVFMFNNVYLYICGFVTDVFPLFFYVKPPFSCALHWMLS